MYYKHMSHTHTHTDRSTNKNKNTNDHKIKTLLHLVVHHPSHPNPFGQPPNPTKSPTLTITKHPGQRAKTAWSKCVSTKDCPKCSAWNQSQLAPVDNPTKNRFQWDRLSWLKQRLVRIGVIDVVNVPNLETLCFFFLLHEFCLKTYGSNLEISKQSKFGFHSFLKRYVWWQKCDVVNH